MLILDGLQGFSGLYPEENMAGGGRLEGDKGSLEDSGLLYAKAYGEMCSTNRIFSAESKVLGFGKQD